MHLKELLWLDPVKEPNIIGAVNTRQRGTDRAVLLTGVKESMTVGAKQNAKEAQSQNALGLR